MRLYRHYKGNIYALLHDSAIEEGTGKRLCVYMSCATGNVFVRHYSEFFGNHMEGNPRFTQLQRKTEALERELSIENSESKHVFEGWRSRLLSR